MSLKHKIIFIFSLPAFIVSVIGCGISNQQIPLPTGALGYVPNLSKTGPAQIKLPYNQISIPFPYIDIFSNGTEQWDLEMDTSGKTILRGYWTSNGRSSENKEIAIYPVEGVGDYILTGELILGGKTYDALSVHINTEEITTGSGWVVLQKK